MTPDVGFITLLVVVIGLSAFFGVRMGRREGRLPVRLIQPWQRWTVYAVQVAAAGLIFTEWLHVISPVWGQGGQLLLVSSLVVVAALEGRRSMLVINALLAVVVAASML